MRIDKVYHQWYTLSMGKIKKNNHVFVTWKGDHSPRHVHIYKDRKLIVKWDLENECAMKGEMNSKILKSIRDLQKSGDL